MHQLILTTILITFGLGLSSCTVYRSPERHDFENEYPQYKSENITTQLRLISCSKESVASYASSSRIVYAEPAQFVLSEHIINHSLVLESYNLKGDFCIYEDSTYN